jgi:hypothetical protein
LFRTAKCLSSENAHLLIFTLFEFHAFFISGKLVGLDATAKQNSLETIPV